MSRTINTMPFNQQFEEGKDWHNIASDMPGCKKSKKKSYARKMRRVSREMCENYILWEEMPTVPPVRGSLKSIPWDLS